MIDHTDTPHGTAALRHRLFDGRIFAEILADDVEIERGAHDDDTVTAQNENSVVLLQMQRIEEFMKIAEAQRTHDNAQETSIEAGDAPAQHHSIIAAIQARTTDKQ